MPLAQPVGTWLIEVRDKAEDDVVPVSVFDYGGMTQAEAEEEALYSMNFNDPLDTTNFEVVASYYEAGPPPE